MPDWLNQPDQDKNQIIKDHIPFIIKSVSDVTGRYVTLENDEMSIGLLAFNEAIEKYDATKGHFLAFAKLVIRSRLLNYLQRENRYNQDSSLDELNEAGIEFASDLCSTAASNQEILVHEIESLKRDISPFGFSLEALADDCPKHKDTRDRAIHLSRNVSQNQALVSKLYEKLRLPIKLISIQYEVSEKIIKGSKKFIITVIIIFDKKYRNILQWVEGRSSDVL